MDVHEAQRDIDTIRAVAAGLPRNRDAVYVLLSQIYLIAIKWIESGQARVLRDAIIVLEGLRIDPRVKRNLGRFLIELGYPVARPLRSVG